VPLAALEQVIDAYGGRVLGKSVLHLWGSALSTKSEREILQLSAKSDADAPKQLLHYFQAWYDTTVNLPGIYYLQVVSWLYKENRLAEGRFVALGHQIDLRSLCHPIFLLGGRDDDVVAPEQLFGTANRVGTARQHIEIVTEPCGHLSLFIGARTIKRRWTQVAQWLGRS